MTSRVAVAVVAVVAEILVTLTCWPFSFSCSRLASFPSRFADFPSLLVASRTSDANEYAAKVVDVGAKGVKVHYTGWKKSWCVPSDRHTRAKTERASQSESARER